MMMLLHSSSSLSGASARATRAPKAAPISNAVRRNMLRTHATAAGAAAPVRPTPVVKIDNISDAFATVVTVEFGESQAQTGELLDAVMALKNLGLNIRKAKLAGPTSNSFFITDADTSEKIIRSARLEDIRLTLINSLVAKFPETSEAFGIKARSGNSDAEPRVLGGVRRVVQTTIEVAESSNGSCSTLKITTPDRAGLLVDIVRVLKDVNLNVVSAEIDTVGPTAQDEFFVTYHGEPLTTPMVTLVTNALQYYLSLAEVAKEESY